MRDGLRRVCGVDEDDEGFDNPGVDSLLNQSWWELTDTFKFKEKETSRTDNTVIGTNTIAVQADINGLQVVSIQDLNSDQHNNLNEITIRDFEEAYVDRTEARGKPTHYIRRGSNIILWPTPDDVYEITSYYWKTLADLVSGGPTIPQSWDEVIMWGGIWRGFAQLGDFNRKRGAKETQLELLSTKETDDVKEKTNRPYSGVQMIRPPYR